MTASYAVNANGRLTRKRMAPAKVPASTGAEPPLLADFALQAQAGRTAAGKTCGDGMFVWL
jgi:hypothetical protein